MNLSLTTACNRRCAYCFQKGWYLTKEALEMPLDDAKEIVRRFAKDSVSLLGGEPLLYSRLPELLEFLKTEGKSVMLITNASTDNFKEIEPFIGSPITGFLLNSDYPKDCSSSPQINVESWREFNTQKELIAALGAKRAEYLKSQFGCSPACPDYERCYRPCVSKIKFYPNKVKKVDDSP